MDAKGSASGADRLWLFRAPRRVSAARRAGPEAWQAATAVSPCAKKLDKAWLLARATVPRTRAYALFRRLDVSVVMAEYSCARLTVY